MIGANELRLSKATMLQALQEWWNQRVNSKAAAVVYDVAELTDGTFQIKIREPEV